MNVKDASSSPPGFRTWLIIEACAPAKPTGRTVYQSNKLANEFEQDLAREKSAVRNPSEVGAPLASGEEEQTQQAPKSLFAGLDEPAFFCPCNREHRIRYPDS
jgi:hypothetical protein